MSVNEAPQYRERHDPDIVSCFGAYFIQLCVRRENSSVHQMVLATPVGTCVTIILTALMDLMSWTVLQVSYYLYSMHAQDL